jgi:hypothetical protein
MFATKTNGYMTLCERLQAIFLYEQSKLAFRVFILMRSYGMREG